LAIADESGDWFVTNVAALVEIYFKDVWAVTGKRQDSSIIKLVTIIKFKLGRSAES
jgi:hypothetical protein